MKFASIYLSNYIGIYNGMGLHELHIDMTKCRYRTTIIRGDNGSGKSTLSKAMSLFPDPNDSFIPGLPARKEIILVDGEILYRLSFIHDVKQNGERETTKAYITKTFGGQAVELNENGNVSSYKDILYDELGLDANFAALSQLSSEDRGLADKKPAERKRFVNSIITSLETYNNIHKTLTKRSTNYKSMINSVVGKLSVLGDEKSLTDNLEAIENKINILQNDKDAAIASLAKEQSTISILDPDGSIQNSHTVILAELGLAEKELNKIKATIEGLTSSHSITTTDFNTEYNRIQSRKSSLIIDNQIAKNSIDSLLRQKEDEATKLNQKMHKLASIKSDQNYDTLISMIEEYTSRIESIKADINSIGIDNIENISRDEYIAGLEMLKELDHAISIFKESIDFKTREDIIYHFISTGNIIDRIDIRNLDNELASYKEDLVASQREYDLIQSRIGLLDSLTLRPDNCKDDSCPFIREAVDFSKTNPLKRSEFLIAHIEGLNTTILECDCAIDKADQYNDSVNLFANIVREVKKDTKILRKMPNGWIFDNDVEFFDMLMSGHGFEYMKEMYKYMDYANLFDVYRNTLELLNKCKADLKVYESKIDVINEINQDIENINQSINSIIDKIEPIKQEIYERELEIAKLQELEGVYEAIFTHMDKLKEYTDKVNDCNTKLHELDKKMNSINIAKSNSVYHAQQINSLTASIEPLMKERDKLNHSVEMMRDYIKEKEQLEYEYNYIETIRYYSSPTTGIQLVFMELYMGKIIALANKLLALLFGGQFEIKPFIINETEFRIPCLGTGYLNDDISSMSSSQVGMISMILSFALLHHSSTKYNIIKLDEIDGALDYTNRVYFADVLNSIMDIMGTEQCIMISHNSELQVDNADVILLKHDKNNPDYMRGNIIWSY